MISLSVVILVLALSFGGFYFILRSRKNGFFEEEIGKKHPPGFHPHHRTK